MGTGASDEPRPGSRQSELGLVKCTAHGLHFDPKKSAGCVLCRRQSVAPKVDGPRLSPLLLLTAGCLALAGTSLGALYHHRRSVAAAGSSASAAASGTAPFDPNLHGLRPFDARDPLAAQRAARQDAARAAIEAALLRIDAQSQGCQASDTEACLSLANDCRFTSGLGGPGSLLGVAHVEVDPVRLRQVRQQCRDADRSLRKLCDDGNPKACEQARGSGLASPKERERACDLGSAPACHDLAQRQHEDPVAAEAAKMRGEQLLKCEQNPAVPCVADTRAALMSQASAALKARAREKCRSGSAEDCQAGADAYQRGLLEDLALSAELRQAACNKGSDEACMGLSKLLAEGRGLPRDERRALELHDQYMKLALDKIEHCNSALGCAYLKMALAEQGELGREIERARISDAALIAECDTGKLLACDALRFWYQDSSNKNASASLSSAYGQKANLLYERECQAGNVERCITLGARLLESPPRDPERGQRVIDGTCSRGSYLACWFLGERTHLGPHKNPTQSAAYYQRALSLAEPQCAARDANACYVLASAYTLGKGVPEDEKKAMTYLEKMHTSAEP